MTCAGAANTWHEAQALSQPSGRTRLRNISMALLCVLLCLGFARAFRNSFELDAEFEKDATSCRHTVATCKKKLDI